MLYTPPTGSTDPNAPYIGKNVAAGIQGSKVPPKAIENPQRELMSLIAEAGLAPTNSDLAQALRAIRGGKLATFDDTGAVNAIAIAPSTAHADLHKGLPFRLFPSFTNTSTTVTVAINTIAPVRLKKRDGSDPAIGDVVAGSPIDVVSDGTNLRLLGLASSDILALLTGANLNIVKLGSPYLGLHGNPVSAGYATGLHIVGAYAGVTNNLPGATLSGGIVTVGTTGFYTVTANLASLMPDTTGSYGYALSVSKVDGGGTPILSIAATTVLVSSVSVSGSNAGSASGVARSTAGDRIAAFLNHDLPSTTTTQGISLDIQFLGT